MMLVKECLVLFVVACCMWAVSCDHDQVPEPNFLSTLVSRVLHSEPMEIREYRTSCIREPGCRWKCPDGGAECLCVCGSDKSNKRKTGSNTRQSTK